MIDLEAPTREDTEEQEIDIEKDGMHSKMDRPDLFNMASQHFRHRMKQELVD